MQEAFAEYLAAGYDIRPTIAVTKAHVGMPEIKDAIEHSYGKRGEEVVTEEQRAQQCLLAQEGKLSDDSQPVLSPAQSGLSPL